MSMLLTPNDEDSIDLLESTSHEEIGLSCEKCGAGIDAHDTLVCRKCGWYGSIGSFVEIDQRWEGNEDSQDEETSIFKLPAWAWTMIACVAVVIAESFAARVLTTADSPERTIWSVTQLFTGITLFAVCQFTAFVMYMREVSDAGLLDLFLKPIKPWIMRVRELPRYQWLCHLAVSSYVATNMSFTVIGGLPYEKLWDWGIQKPVKQNLVGAIVSQAQSIEGEEKPLEEAIKDFAGTQNLNGKGGKKPKKNSTAEPKPRQQEDCLIVGYRTNAEGLVYNLYLAGESVGTLQYVGQVAPRLSVNELRTLSEQLATYQANTPFVTIPDEGVQWVKPRFTCRISYASKGQKGRLYDLKFESLLGEVDVAEK